jgi:hypothetical protein
MRRFIYCLLIAFTALRGFVGDAMALEMSLDLATHNTPSQHQAVAPSEPAVHAMPCHGASGVQTDHDLAAADGSKDRCTACQVCHLNVVTAAPFLVASQHLTAVTPHQASLIWHSASLAQLSKPPIS